MNKNKISLYLLITVVVLLAVYVAYNYFGKFFDSSFFIALITLLVGSIVIFLYSVQKRDAKINAARIILQEIRRAEDIISRYKEQGNFQFTRKIIANNSWGINIHYFVNDLSQDELDKISNTYSTGEFLDRVIFNVYEWKFEYSSNDFYEKIPKVSIVVPPNPNISSSSSAPQDSQIIPIPKPINNFWVPMLNDVVSKYEFIYHSTVVEELKKIAKIK